MNQLPIYKTEGIIIRTADLGELDRLLVVYTRGYGKISVRAISAHKRGSKLRGLLEPFTYGRFLLAKSKTLDIVTDIEVADNFSWLRQNLPSLGLAYYFAELIDRLVVAPEPDEDLWRLVSRAFSALNQPRSDWAKLKELFEGKLLEFLGYGMAQNKKPLMMIQELINGEIKSQQFLSAAGVS